MISTFDTNKSGYANEANRFGWIVEVDPRGPQSTPLKHTSPRTVQTRGSENTTSRTPGTAVAYMGDDEKFDYLYKFVSKGKYIEGDLSHNMTLLTGGRSLRCEVHRQLTQRTRSTEAVKCRTTESSMAAGSGCR